MQRSIVVKKVNYLDPADRLALLAAGKKKLLLNLEGVPYIDSAGRTQDVYGILTLYALRGDGLRITYMDPWLPSDESREVCGPERGTVPMAGLSGSGSTVMVISRGAEVYTRLYEFDVSGGNSMFFDYSWQDQDGVASPKAQGQAMIKTATALIKP